MRANGGHFKARALTPTKGCKVIVAHRHGPRHPLNVCRLLGSPNLLCQRPLLPRRGLRAVGSSFCLNALQRRAGSVKFPAGCLGIFRQRWIVGPWPSLPDPDQEGPLRLTNDAAAAASSSSTLAPTSNCHKNAPRLLTKFLQPAQLQRRQARPSLARAPQMTPPKTRQRTPRKMRPLLQLRLLMSRPSQTRPESWLGHRQSAQISRLSSIRGSGTRPPRLGQRGCDLRRGSGPGHELDRRRRG